MCLLVFIFGLTFGAKADAATLRWAEIDKGVVSHAYRAGSMMVQKDKVSQINQIYGTSMFDGTKWTDSAASTFDGVGDMFLDSRGITYVGGVNHADGLSYIYESTDGLNWTPVQQFVDASGGGYIWNFTEDKYGNVWAGEYTSRDASTGEHLWRRSPGGVWTNVVNWNKSDGLLDDHIHNVYYDPFRDALYVAIGDQDRGILKLPSDKINASSLFTSDFSVIVPIAPNGHGTEVTAITSDVSYIYVAMDTHTAWPETRSLARITDNNIDTPTMEYVYSTGEGSLGCAVWNWAHVDDNGVIIFYANGTAEFTCTSGHFVNRIVASNDHGTTWQVVKDFGNTYGNITGSNGSVGLPSYYATNWSGLYGFGNGWGGVPLRAIIGRVLPVNQTFYVDGTDGVDWTNFGVTQARPVKTLNYLEMLDIQHGDTVNFIGSNTYSNPLIAGWSGNGASNISLRGNTTSIFSGGNLANTPSVAETFESVKGSWNFTLNEAGGSVTADTSIVHGGAQSAKIVRGASGTTSLNLKNVATTNINEGDTMYLSYWLYYPDDQTAGSDQTMLRILDNSSYELRMRRTPSHTSALSNEITLNPTVWSTWLIPSRKSLSSGAWHKIYIEDYLHSTNGSFKMYVDNVLWYNINGIKTVTAGGKMDSVYFFNYENPITYYVDDFKFGKLPFDDQGAINTNYYNYLDFGNFKFGGTIGSIISSNSSNINIHNSIFNGLTNDALISNGSSNINLFNNSIYTSGRYGFNASSDATFKNNLVYDSVSNDTLIGSGATVSGSNNWFKSSAKNGTGTYSDLGNTIWSGANPMCVDASVGNYNLQSTSPVIDAGTGVGLTSDYAGNPIYGLPDIGAYEYQPPYDMGTNEVDISANVRVYGDGKFRNTETTGGTTADFSVIPQGSDTTKWLDILPPDGETDLIWEANHKRWKESSTTLGGTNTLHTIGDLTAGKSYSLKIDNVLATVNITGTDCVAGVCTADESNQIIFTYTGGYSDHTFDLTDDIAPVLTITSPASGADVSGDDTFDFTDSEKTDPQCSLNNIDWQDCESTVTLFDNLTGWNDIDEGDTFTLYIKDTDASNNTGTTQVDNLIKADTQAPIRSDKSPAGELSSSMTSTTISLKTSENATCKYSTSGNTSYSDMSDTFTTTGTTSHSQDISGLSSGNSYAYYVRCQDGSNNRNDTDYLISFSVAQESSDNEENDNNERDINVNKVKAVSTENSITITWKTDHNAKSTIRYGTNKNLKQKKNDNQKEKNHKVILKNLLPDTLYYFRIKSEDGNDNTDSSKIHSIKTQPAKTQNFASLQSSDTPLVETSRRGVSTTDSNPNICNYTVQSGDALWRIALQVYGDAKAYPLIIEKNKDKYPNIASGLLIGQELTFGCNSENQGAVQGASDTKDTTQSNNQETTTPETPPDSGFRWWNPWSWF